jgi:hypothetical protein
MAKAQKNDNSIFEEAEDGYVSEHLCACYRNVLAASHAH